MAKRIIQENYTFTPSTRTIVISNRFLRREQLLLITNVTTNTVIYNFSDTALTASAFSASTSGNVESTTIVLTYNTTSMSASDKLSILVEETNETFQPAEAYIDPVQKMRVSTPQSMIDTDFEYGVQPTKWETVNLMNNRPSGFYDPTAPIVFTGISGGGANRTVTVTLNTTTGIIAGNPVYIQDSTDPICNGYFVVNSVSAGVNFTYIVSTTTTVGNIFDATKTYIFNTIPYTGAGIAVSTTATAAFTANGTEITCVTKDAHGLSIGDAIMVCNTTAATSNPPNGAWFVRRTPNSTTFLFDVINAPVGNITAQASGSGLTLNTTVDSSGRIINLTINVAGTLYAVGDIVSISGSNVSARAKVTAIIPSATGSLVGAVNGIQINDPGSGGYSSASAVATTLIQSGGSLYVRPWGSAIHRPFDGGVYFTAGLPYHGNILIRQTRRYFRYQSGKGIQFSTGSNMCAPFIIDSLTASGTAVTVNTKFPHNLFNGANIRVSGADQSSYNGVFNVTFLTPTSFTYTAGSAPAVTPATGNITVQPNTWFGATIRLGMFDNQNGFYFEYDGQTLYAVRRSSTTQLAGYVSQLGCGEQVVRGINCRWATQLNPGDFIVIRGMSYTVLGVDSDNQMTIYPDYRGSGIVPPTQCIISRTDILRTPQSSWNIDRMDGTGESGFNIDINKMQMWYIDYTWYGAGTIRWGFRTQRGTVLYAHRLAHGNNMTEAYMRTGNLPARYEVSTIAPFTRLTATLTNTTTATMDVVSTTGFPNTGTLIVSQAQNIGGIIEYINYSGRTATQFQNLVRAIVTATGPQGLFSGGGTSTAFTFAFTASSYPSVSYYSPQCSNTIAHWGSSVIMDGRYDDDKNLVFIAGMTTALSNIGAGVTAPLLSIRVAPSVDNGLTGLLGQRELINRMQLTLRSTGIQTAGTNFLVTGRLNARITGGTQVAFQPVGGSSLSQVCYHSSGQTISGGEITFGAFTSPGVNVLDLTVVRDLGNSILGGGQTLVYPANDLNKYPDGPDILTLAVQNTGGVTSNSAIARIGWTEAQA